MRNAVSLRFAAMRAVSLDLAEIRREQELLFASQRLLGKDDEVVGEKSRVDRSLLLRQQRPSEIDALDPYATRGREARAHAIEKIFMPGLDPVIHGGAPNQVVDGRIKSGHDGWRGRGRCGTPTPNHGSHPRGNPSTRSPMMLR